MKTSTNLSDLAAWAADDRGCGAQGIADTMRRGEGRDGDALEACVRWRKEGRGVVLATVVASDDERFGPGARIACSDDRLLAGSLNDAALEESVAEATVSVLRSAAVGIRGWTRLDDLEWSPDPDGGTRILLEPFLPPWEVVVVGSGRVPSAVAALCAAAGIPFRVYHADQEDLEFPGAREIVRGPWEELAARMRLGAASHCVVATPHHDGDGSVVGQLLSADWIPYVGLMHNERKAQRLVASLEASGIRIDRRFHCPIGLAVATQNPGQIGLGILAEILSVVNSKPIRHMGLDWSGSRGEAA
ncbi:MAG TPA: XdhC family protein [Fibrobacteria bacterium]|nr:XdhC family protein [Fibrobacteria bacterium]